MSKEFFSNLKAARIAVGISQIEMANKLGVAKSTYSMYESGNREPNIQTIRKIADILGVSVEYLMTGEENERQTYYLNEETSKVAQDIFENKDLRMLFDAARDAAPEDLQAVHNMLLALKQKEQRVMDSSQQLLKQVKELAEDEE